MENAPSRRTPKRAIVLLLDSLNRHMLGAYGGREFATPNLDRLAARALRFTRHYTGSLPCIPARHDLLCGALDFLWKPWGSIEIWEESLTALLRARRRDHQARHRPPAPVRESAARTSTPTSPPGTTCAGTRAIPWQTRPDPSWAGAPSFHRGWTPYDDSRGYFRDEADFPGPRTMAAAARLARRARARTTSASSCWSTSSTRTSPSTRPSRTRRCTIRAGRARTSSGRRTCAARSPRGILDERQARQIRASYGAKLTMIDAWLGRVLDVLDRTGPVGRHRGDRLHRPRPLPRREGHLGQARGAGLRAARPHPAADRVARRRAARRSTR